MQNFSSKMQPLTYFSSQTRQIARKSAPGSSHVFRPLTKELLPNDAAPGVSATLAKTIHSVHVSICFFVDPYLCFFVYPTFAHSTCSFP